MTLFYARSSALLSMPESDCSAVKRWRVFRYYGHWTRFDADDITFFWKDTFERTVTNEALTSNGTADLSTTLKYTKMSRLSGWTNCMNCRQSLQAC